MHSYTAPCDSFTALHGTMAVFKYGSDTLMHWPILLSHLSVDIKLVISLAHEKLLILGDITGHRQIIWRKQNIWLLITRHDFNRATFLGAKNTTREVKTKYLTDFESGERIVNDANQHPFSFQRVGCPIQEEAPRLLLGCFDQHVAPVEVPAVNNTGG